jgi:8-oxo-dGTP pyrophosphatase MutT (NUDIX family)
MKKRSYLVYIKNNKVLLVREKKDDGYKLPGGRFEQNETSLQCLERELKEELDAVVDHANLELIGDYIYRSSNYGDWKTYIYKGDLLGQPNVDGEEIAETAWFSLSSNLPLRPHMQSHILPLLINGGYLK